MINFRFHLVSLIAVFLALGLGILVGSTVIDQGIVDRLDTRDQQRPQGEQARARPTSKQLAKQNQQLQQFIDQVGAVRRRRPARRTVRRGRRRARRRQRRRSSRPSRRCRRPAPTCPRSCGSTTRGSSTPTRECRRSQSALDAAGRRGERRATPRSTCSRTGSPRRRPRRPRPRPRVVRRRSTRVVDLGGPNHDVVDARRPAGRRARARSSRPASSA